MSAWVVSKAHIDLMVDAALHAVGTSRIQGERFRFWRTDGEGDYVGWYEADSYAAEEALQEDETVHKITPSRLGQMLVDECVRSVSGRYPDDDAGVGELPGPIDAYYMGPYVYEQPCLHLTPAEVFRAIDCYEYQSCEHDGWRASNAFAFCESLRQRVCKKVDGYEAAPWGFDAAHTGGSIRAYR